MSAPPELPERSDNVFALYDPHQRRHEPPMTAAEIAEWRRMAPHLRLMLRQFQTITVDCPVARHILLTPD